MAAATIAAYSSPTTGRSTSRKTASRTLSPAGANKTRSADGGKLAFQVCWVLERHGACAFAHWAGPGLSGWAGRALISQRSSCA